MSEVRNRKIPVNFWRRLSQVVFLALFLWLFRQTDYGGTDEIPYAVNIFFRWDPLVGAAAMLAARTFISLFLPALVVVGLTLVLGRFFCGWVCPLGTLLDWSHRLIPPREGLASPRYRPLKYFLLFFILLASLFGLPLVGYFDPFSILVRGFTLAVDPAFYFVVSSVFDFLYKHVSWITPASEPIYSFLKADVLPFKQSLFLLALPTFAALLAVFLLERIERRFWCRNLCPLGGLLGLCSRPALLRQHPGVACKNCTTCADICRMGAINAEGRISPEACNLCLDCVADCDKQIISFKFKRPKPAPAPLGISRRGLITTAVIGIFLPAFFKVRASLKARSLFLIRPPGAREESEFLARCVRCGECMKVCINNALQPAGLEAGAEGLWSPVLVPRLGYCEFNCTLCGQVCPSGAIQQLAKADKQKTVIGRAYFEKDRCIPYAKGETCLVCEEHCPVPDKAIKFREATVRNQRGEENVIRQPYIVDNLCIGCGICEFKCPVPGAAAVRVTREGESRDPESQVETFSPGEG